MKKFIMIPLVVLLAAGLILSSCAEPEETTTPTTTAPTTAPTAAPTSEPTKAPTTAPPGTTSPPKTTVPTTKPTAEPPPSPPTGTLIQRNNFGSKFSYYGSLCRGMYSCWSDFYNSSIGFTWSLDRDKLSRNNSYCIIGRSSWSFMDGSA